MDQMPSSKSVERRPVAGACSHCAAQALARYEVLSEGGWFTVVKCQQCLVSLERVPWRPHGYLVRDSFAAIWGEAEEGR